MKTVFALAIALATLSSNAQAAIPYTILEAVRTPGFEMHPQSRHFYVQDDGKMTLEITNHRDGNKTETIDLGTLSEAAVRSLQKQVDQITADDKLVDPREGQPMCTDTPHHTTSVFVKGVRKEISKSFGCHQWKLESGEGQGLISLGAAFIRM